MNNFKQVNIQNKGVGLVATRDINKGEIIIIDTPITINTYDNNHIYSDIFQLLYKVLNNTQLTKKFMKLCPKNLIKEEPSKNYDNLIKNITTELNKVKSINKQVYDFFVTNYSKDELLLYCLKYMCNAFDYMGKPSFLFTGTLLNHSCLPNTIFIPTNGKVIFISARQIKKGEELTDNYVNILDDINIRKKRLLEQYGFDCSCDRCIKLDYNRSTKLDDLAKELIEFKNNCLQKKYII